MKIILADPPRISNFRYRAYYPNLGLLYISAYLKEKVPDIEVHYLEHYISLEDHIKAIKEIQPDLYGISFASYVRDVALATVDAVREACPDLPIVAGGAHPTVAPGDCLDAGVDFCVIGEGEETALALFNAIVSNGKNMDAYKDVTGIVYKDAQGQHVRTEKRPFISNLDILPFPDWDLCDITKYGGSIIRRGTPALMNIISRGCPYDCNFCANPIWKANKPWVRMRSPENIAEELQLIYDRGYREVTLRCDEFNIPIEWTKDVCRAIKKLNLKDMYFNTLMRAAPMDEELCSLMADINLWSVNIGIESANERVLKGVGKYVSLQDVRKCCELFRKYKIRAFGFFMMFSVWEENGEVQFETVEEVSNSLNFAKSLVRQKLLNNVSWGFVSPTPGSRLYDTCEKFDLIDENAYKISKYKATTMKIPGLDEKTMQTLRREGELLRLKCSLTRDLFNINFNLKNLGYLWQRFSQGWFK